MQTIQHWIAGGRTSGGSTRTSPVWDPATGQQRGQVLLAETADVDHAVAVAADAFESWSQSSLTRRSAVLFEFRELLRRRANDLAGLIADEHGKVFADALGEVQRGLEVVEFACGIPQLLKGEYSDQVSTGVDSYTFRQPVGVVVGIAPFNFPMMVPAWMHPMAIACGNSFVLKPSERVPSASMLIAELWTQAGLPDGVFNVVHGDKVAVDRLLEAPAVAAVSFVGSTAVARYVHERATAVGKRVQALGGAKNHAVVLPDADLKFAAAHLTAAAFGSAGQRCMAISVAVAVEPVGDRLIELLRNRAAAIRVGPGRQHDSEMGPLVTNDARQRVTRYVDSGERQGAVVAVDGRHLVVDGHAEGYFVGPTVLDHVQVDMDVYQDEIFGPVLAVVRVATPEAAIALINANQYGNGTAVFTNSGESARAFQRAVNVGMVGINVPIPIPMAYHSFGGWKDSAFGESRMHGPDGIRFYTRGKVVTQRWPQVEQHEVGSYHFPTGS
ncbi:CoA-acylating methylmalonate-semialdehyde dehydrogenase [Nonomuraea aurantiaca]|uniref:CoA-acylating methylmalonate-semialdehyde dehydrogenase n=1 Tax=Nonomuraea aurantiaca TaxID=2878562 RepID=UPI001CD96BB0|nr:CoA-acylating methylmalonate-semialdehyde dehydrogenase [Nonomuraea aurantiaca]MCA2226364.1 CoA-acylating methylmalonate-semialdehyde dehydrogenase [Nonomuraea aurantiaca]